MFDPNQLRYAGRQRGIDVFYYGGIRIDASIAREDGQQVLYVGLGRELPERILSGLLAWFGLDRGKDFSEYEFPDESCYFVQRRAA